MKYTCPCCGYKVLDNTPGNYDICPICFWEDDGFQTDNPFCAEGANKVSLYQAQKNYLNISACEERFKKKIREPYDYEVKDEKWNEIKLLNKRIKEVLIDISSVNSIEDLHLILKKSLGFPDFYGMNWDAFWDTITGLVDMPKNIVFKGWYLFELNFFRESRIIKQLFEDFEKEYPELSSKITYL